MGRITRLEFIGNRPLFVLLCLSIIGIPSAILYALHTTVAIGEDVDNPTEFLDAFKQGKVTTDN